MDNRISSILIVEDEKIIAMDMKHHLNRFGYSVCSIIDNGEDAISYAIQNNPNLILMDIMLKGKMDGIEAADQIIKNKTIPIIFVTAFTDDETLEKVSKANAYGYIVKPYNERVLKITIELALSKYELEKQIQKAKEAAENSNKIKTLFLSNISHELKTPLNVIMESFDVIKSISKSNEINECVSLATKSAKKLDYLTASLLDFTKLENDEVFPVYSEFYLENFLLSCWDTFVDDAIEKEICPRFFIDPYLPVLLYCDQVKLGIIIRSLLDNAIKFTKKGFVLLSAKKNDDELIISIQDTGIGITKDLADSIFDAFVQGDGSATRAVGGLGLGLSITKKLINILDLHLEYDSDEKNGTTFNIHIPFCLCHGNFYPWKRYRPALTFGLYGKISSWQEIYRWAPALGINIKQLITENSVESYASSVDVIIAEVSSQEIKNYFPNIKMLYELMSKKIVLLSKFKTNSDGKNDFEFKELLDIPHGIISLAKIIDKLFVNQTAKDETIKISKSNNKVLINRDYQKLIADAKKEAVSLGIQDNLDSFINSFTGDTEKISPVSFEKTAKYLHDFFTDSGAIVCAKLALAVSIDIRNDCYGELANTFREIQE